MKHIINAGAGALIALMVVALGALAIGILNMVRGAYGETGQGVLLLVAFGAVFGVLFGAAIEADKSEFDG